MACVKQVSAGAQEVFVLPALALVLYSDLYFTSGLVVGLVLD